MVCAKRSVVLIMASKQDIHAASVAFAIRRKYPEHKVFIVDGRDFPSAMSLSIRDGGWTLGTSEATIHSSEVSSIWMRRPMAPVVDPLVVDEAARSFAFKECVHTFDFLSMSREYKIVNRVENQFLANRKPYQLSIARQCGFSIPEYNVTNDPAYIAELLDHQPEGSFIFKTLSAPVHTFGETRSLLNSHRMYAESLRIAPAIFQKKIDRKKEIRVTVIGSRIFSHEIIINNEVVKSLPDWRLDVTAESKETILADTLLKKIRLFMRTMGLYYGAIDLIESNDGESYFLEVNPQGQFLFNEIDTEAPMSDAFADLLVDADPG